MEKDFIVPAERVKMFKPYFFSTLGKKISKMRSEGKEIIRIDVGSPDLPPADFIIEKLNSEARKATTHGYTSYGGTPLFKNAIAKYYQRRFNVDLDPSTEITTLLGSKEGLFDLPIILANPGDAILIPDPSYPVYIAGAKFVNADIHFLPLVEKNNFLPDLEAIPADVLKKAKIMWLNYPNNPTGAVAPMEFFEKVINFCRKHEIIVAHDAPYTEVCFDGYAAPSILQVPGAKDVAIEFNSLSKAYNMGGWRLGMAVGNAKVINLLQTYTSQMDTSHFDPVLTAGAEALTGDQSWLEGRNEVYQERRDIVLDAIRKVGLTANTPPATIYVWAKIPEKFSNSVDFCNDLLNDTGVSVTPGSVYGQCGEGYVRISLGVATDKLKIAVEKLAEWVVSK